MRPPLRITHSGSQPLKRIGEAISLVFSGESPFRAPNGAGSLAVGMRSGYVTHNVAKPSLIPDSVIPGTRLRPKREYGRKPRSDSGPPQADDRDPGKEESR